MKNDLYQTGTEPEFTVMRIAKIERAWKGALRLYCASEREGHLRLEYTVIVPIQVVTGMARQMLLAMSEEADLSAMAH